MFAAEEGTPLAALADEERRGTWRLTIVDRRVEKLGTLGGGGLRFGEGVGATIRRRAIPYPIRSARKPRSRSGADDAFVIVGPVERGAIGSVALWDFALGRLTGDLRRRCRRSTSRSTTVPRAADRRRERRDAVERR